MFYCAYPPCLLEDGCQIPQDLTVSGAQTENTLPFLDLLAALFSRVSLATVSLTIVSLITRFVC